MADLIHRFFFAVLSVNAVFNFFLQVQEKRAALSGCGALFSEKTDVPPVSPYGALR
jgi:hypothetical protein